MLVTSWRDSATPEAQDDLDGLVNEALPFATQMLEQHGEFFPYAVALHSSGESRLVAGAMAVFLPYKPKRLRRGIDFGDLSAASGTQQVWTS